MAGLYVTLIKLDPGAQTRITSGPWERVEIDGGDVVGYDEDENPAHIASQHSDVETYYATNPMHPGVRFDRVQITVGEPE